MKAKSMPKYVSDIIEGNMKELNPRGEYILRCTKYTSAKRGIYSRLAVIETWAKRFESEVTIIMNPKIIGDYRVAHIKVNGIASNLIDEVLHEEWK